jgi:hypothetical protein
MPVHPVIDHRPRDLTRYDRAYGVKIRHCRSSTQLAATYVMYFVHRLPRLEAWVPRGLLPRTCEVVNKFPREAHGGIALAYSAVKLIPIKCYESYGVPRLLSRSAAGIPVGSIVSLSSQCKKTSILLNRESCEWPDKARLDNAVQACRSLGIAQIAPDDGTLVLTRARQKSTFPSCIMWCAWPRIS